MSVSRYYDVTSISECCDAHAAESAAILALTSDEYTRELAERVVADIETVLRLITGAFLPLPEDTISHVNAVLQVGIDDALAAYDRE